MISAIKSEASLVSPKRNALFLDSFCWFIKSIPMIKTPWSPQTVKSMDDLLGPDLDANGVDPYDVPSYWHYGWL
jgi:hypothetical protein